jgi:hypothetical protein
VASLSPLSDTVGLEPKFEPEIVTDVLVPVYHVLGETEVIVGCGGVYDCCCWVWPARLSPEGGK